MITELVVAALALSVAGSTNDSGRLLQDNVYGEVGPEEYDDYDLETYPGYEDTDYRVTEPRENTDETETAVTVTAPFPVKVTTPPTGSGGSTGKLPPSRGPVHYLNGTLYEDYDCSRFKFQGLSRAAPQGRGNGPALAVICVCLALAAICDALKKKSY